MGIARLSVCSDESVTKWIGSDTCLGADHFCPHWTVPLGGCVHMGSAWLKWVKRQFLLAQNTRLQNFTLAADDNQFITSDKSSSWTHNALPPLLKINNRL